MVQDYGEIMMSLFSANIKNLVPYNKIVLMYVDCYLKVI